jgi:hypothetical protein
MALIYTKESIIKTHTSDNPYWLTNGWRLWDSNRTLKHS